MNKPLVSVILDNYNYEDYVEEAIQSVLSQTYENYELIIVDDGSTDGSRKIIDSYINEKRVKVVYKQNGGQMSAFNEAFKVVTGEIVAFLDSDDYWYSDKLEKIVEKHSSYKVVQHYLSNNGNGIYRKVKTDVDWHTVLKDYGYLYNHSVCSSLSFQRELLDEFFPFDNPEEMIYCADGILLMIALFLTDVGFIDEELGFYRIHGNNGFVGKSDYGKKSREILKKQHVYVNRALEKKGYATVPWSETRYFDYLISELLKAGNINKGDKIVIYGTETSGLYMTRCLEENGLEVIFYVDSNSNKQGEIFLDRLIKSPKELVSYTRCWDCVIIASSAQEAISNTLNQMGLFINKDYYSLPI